MVFKCIFCDKTFTRKDNLSRHLKKCNKTPTKISLDHAQTNYTNKRQGK